MKQLTALLAGDRRNKWITCCKFSIYVRVAFHATPVGVVETLDIGNITLPGKLRGKGRFKKLLVDIENLLEGDALRGTIQAIYIESLLNKRLETHLANNGFEYASIREDDLISPCLYKLLTTSGDSK